MSKRSAAITPKALGLSIVFALAANPALAQTSISTKNGVFPITITKSGSYKLTGNLVVPPGVDGIVLAPDVDASIDLNSFTISGPAVCSKSVNCYQQNGTIGIRVQPEHTLNVFNGHVTGFTTAGVGQPSGFNYGTVIARNLKVTSNGVGVRAYVVMAENVLALDNSGTGIYGDTGSVINSIANGNGLGISISMGTIRGCVARANANAGFSFQRTTHQDNVTFDNGVQTQGEGAYSPGFNNGFND